jgi:ubiquinone/menaquinone biosynthesis C-methylase UbiE
LVINMGWRYDLFEWVIDPLLFRGQLRELWRRTVELPRLQPGEQALDVGCGTGILALAAARRVGASGRVVGIDPSAQQIARARVKAARRNVPIEFQIAVIEELPFRDQTFDVVFSTLMMHHLPAPLKRQGLAEIARVLKPGGRLVIGDFVRKQDRTGRATRFHAGGSSVVELTGLLAGAGFDTITTEALAPKRFSAFPGAGFVMAYKVQIGA